MKFADYVLWINQQMSENMHAADWEITNPQGLEFYPRGETVTLTLDHPPVTVSLD